jgi:hypothetical protein
VEGRFYRRRWDESRGDEFDGWGAGCIEVDDNGRPVRQVEVYDNGPILRYGPGYEEDQYGRLGYVSLDVSGDDWSPFVITRNAFERVWDSAG